MKEKMKEIGSFLFENILGVASDIAKDKGKELVGTLGLETFTQIGADVMIDMGGSMIPAIGPAISTYKTNKKIKNLDIMIQKIADRLDLFEERYGKQSIENKEILDEIFNMITDKISNTYQTEKIEYMVNGYLELLNVKNPSFDTAYLYFDTLDKLTILDLSVLKLSYSVYTPYNRESISEFENYQELEREFDIDDSQYLVIKENLYRFGLLENEVDAGIAKSLDSIQKAVIELRSTTESIYNQLSGKKVKLKALTSKSKIKLKDRDRLKISKFGRQFVQFFVAMQD
ncbi:hypothetical protein [Enterococcus sp. AZ102]|uniref:hypothetical protein n=1 Tax=Enterococcus sp. AZ102 TaxID=2774865 RepID=UPI003F238247